MQTVLVVETESDVQQYTHKPTLRSLNRTGNSGKKAFNLDSWCRTACCPNTNKIVHFECGRYGQIIAPVLST